MVTCPECNRLREETAELFSDYILRKDELSMTRKNYKAFSSKRRALEKVQGRLNEARKREQQHREETHCYNALSIEQKLFQLREHIALGDDDGVQQAIFDLAPSSNGRRSVPDEIVESLLTLLRQPAMASSHLSGHVLNYFEFESKRLTPLQKRQCMAFLEAHGDSFSHVFAMQVVSELREGLWLR